MLGPSFPLRQVSEDVLQELDPARSERPFEWRRSFHIINFVIAEPRVSLSYRLNELALSLHDRDGEASEALVQPGSGVQLAIHGTVTSLDRGDTFLHTRRSPGGDPTLFETFPPEGALQVELSACEPLEGDQLFGAGTYPGQLLAWDPKLEDDTLTLDLRAPASALQDIVDAIQSGKATSLALQVGVRVFTFEVDDALREPYHQQTFVFHGHSAAAAILSLRTLPASPSKTPELDDVLEQHQGGVLPLTRLPNPSPTALTLPSTPLWVIAGLLLLIFLTR